jgi:hypothetical protein
MIYFQSQPSNEPINQRTSPPSEEVSKHATPCSTPKPSSAMLTAMTPSLNADGLDSDASESAAPKMSWNSLFHLWSKCAHYCLVWTWMGLYCIHLIKYPEMLQLDGERLVAEQIIADPKANKWAWLIKVTFILSFVLADCSYVMLRAALQYIYGTVASVLGFGFSTGRKFFRLAKLIARIISFGYSLGLMMTKLGWRVTRLCMFVLFIASHVVDLIVMFTSELYKVARLL